MKLEYGPVTDGREMRPATIPSDRPLTFEQRKARATAMSGENFVRRSNGTVEVLGRDGP
jgi:hypothetical protein